MSGRSYSSPAYRYGFNGQEKDDEVSGSGNTNTAEYWEYDCRLGRRWNLDPKPNPSLSSYACFGNNPVWVSDPKGDTLRMALGQSKEFIAATNTALEKLKTTKEGFLIYNDLQNSDQVFTMREKTAEDVAANFFSPQYKTVINYQTGKTELKPNGGEIVWNIEGSDVPVQQNSKSIFSKMEKSGLFSFAHELGHAEDQSQGKFYKLNQEIKKGLKESEWSASHKENMIRAELNAPLRTHYYVTTNGKSFPPPLLKLTNKGIESKYQKGFFYTHF